MTDSLCNSSVLTALPNLHFSYLPQRDQPGGTLGDLRQQVAVRLLPACGTHRRYTDATMKPRKTGFLG